MQHRMYPCVRSSISRIYQSLVPARAVLLSISATVAPFPSFSYIYFTRRKVTPMDKSARQLECFRESRARTEERRRFCRCRQQGIISDSRLPERQCDVKRAMEFVKKAGSRGYQLPVANLWVLDRCRLLLSRSVMNIVVRATIHEGGLHVVQPRKFVMKPSALCVCVSRGAYSHGALPPARDWPRRVSTSSGTALRSWKVLKAFRVGDRARHL